MRRLVGTVVLVALLPMMTALAEEFSACWVTTVADPFTGVDKPITRCRIAGGDIVDYASDTSISSRLYPIAGTELTGECWYLTSAATNWVYLSLFTNGDAVLGWDPDPTTPGSIVLDTGRIPRCTSEPNLVIDPATEVWEYVTQYIHAPPTPDLSPIPGDGIAGLETFIGLPIPENHETRLVSVTGVTLDVFIKVSGVIVDWGDGNIDSIPPDEGAFAGYPHGVVTHIYEQKHAEGYALAISYDWTARWRVVGGSWQFLTVPNTTTTVTYPVAEIISVITP